MSLRAQSPVHAEALHEAMESGPRHPTAIDLLLLIGQMR